MGSFSRGKVWVGSVVSCSATRTHQFARDESCPISVTTFQDSSSFESSSAVLEPPKLEKQSPNVPEERTGEVECEGDLEEPHRLENSESLSDFFCT
jgi:hypothetical protein